MVESTLLETIINESARLSLTVVLLFLYLTERKSHDETRKQAREDIADKDKELTDTLKEISGIRSNMWSVQSMRNRESDTRPLRPGNIEE